MTISISDVSDGKPDDAGAGSEINCWGVISNPETNEKIGFGDPRLTPKIAIVDPEFMLTVPPRYTAYQGFDALFHNTESIMSNISSIMSETLSISAIENIAKYLPRAVKDGSDLEAMGYAEADKPEDFITALMRLQEDCGVAILKMSDFGIEKTECMTLTKGAKSMQGGLFLTNPCELDDEDGAMIFEKAYR